MSRHTLGGGEQDNVTKWHKRGREGPKISPKGFIWMDPRCELDLKNNRFWPMRELLAYLFFRQQNKWQGNHRRYESNHQLL